MRVLKGKKIASLFTGLVMTASMMTGCAHNTEPAPAPAPAPKKYIPDPEKVARAEQVKVETADKHRDREERRLRQGVALKLVVDAAKIGIVRDGDPGVFGLMAANIGAIDDKKMQEALKKAYKDAGLSDKAIKYVLTTQEIQKCSAALPGMNMFIGKNAKGEPVTSMDSKGASYGPWAKKLEQNPTLCSQFAYNIATLSMKGDGTLLKTYIADDPAYKAYIAPDLVPKNH